MKALIYDTHYLENVKLIHKYIDIVSDHLTEQGHKVVICRDLDCAVNEIADTDIFIGWRFPQELFPHAKNLKWIQFGSAGIDHTLFPELIESNIILTTASGVHALPVAEQVMALMLSLSRRIYLAVENQVKKEWNRIEIAHTAGELTGKTVGIIGLGKIGLQIARFCKCFGMTVIGTKARPAGVLECVDQLYSPAELASVLKQSDVLVLVAPLTSGTQALIGAKELEIMMPGSLIVNVARGQMIDHDALIEQLKSGHISGAGLDVFPQEPLPADSPLWGAPNVIITPHTAGSTPNYPERTSSIFKHNLQAFANGTPMMNVFNRERGY